MFFKMTTTKNCSGVECGSWDVIRKFVICHLTSKLNSVNSFSEEGRCIRKNDLKGQEKKVSKIYLDIVFFFSCFL